MIGILIAIFVGRAFYQLAHEHNRSKGGYTVLGVGIYLAAQFLFAFVLGIVLALTGNLDLVDGGIGGQLLISILAILIGGGITLLVYRSLKKNWESNPNQIDSDILDK